MIVAARALRDRRRSVLWWSLGVVGLMAFTAAFFPAIEGDTTFDDLVADLPDTMRDLFGLGEISLSSAPGYLQARVFSTLLPLLLLIFGIGVGARAIGGAEDDGTIELLLAQPVTRRRVLAERYIAMLTLLVVLGVAAGASLLALSVPVNLLDGVSIAGLVAATAAATLMALLFATLAFAAGAVLGHRAPALGIAAATAVATYLLHGVAGTSDAAHAVRFLSPWHWYADRNMLVDGVAPDALLVPPVLCALLLAVAVTAFDRRDLR